MRSTSLGLRVCAGPNARSARRRGFSLIEVVVTLTILVVAGSIYCQTLLAGRGVREVNREKTIAAEAARVALERMRNRPFLEVYRAYNEDPADDPGGAGTGPGGTFDVEGLEPVDGQAHVGRISFPSVYVPASGGGTGGIGKKTLGGTGTTVPAHWELRENFVDDALGLPRDLDGDNKIDALDHSQSYLLLPVRVRLEWKSGTTPRSFEVLTQLGDFVLPEAP